MLKEIADKLYSNLEKGEVEGRVAYFKKHRVYPIINEEGNINWFNLVTGGTWFKLVLALLFIVVAVGFIWEYHTNSELCIQIINEYNNNTIYKNHLASRDAFTNCFKLDFNNTINIFSNNSLRGD